jgi:hypothetical protein
MPVVQVACTINCIFVYLHKKEGVPYKEHVHLLAQVVGGPLSSFKQLATRIVQLELETKYSAWKQVLKTRYKTSGFGF